MFKRWSALPLIRDSTISIGFINQNLLSTITQEISIYTISQTFFSFSKNVLKLFCNFLTPSQLKISLTDSKYLTGECRQTNLLDTRGFNPYCYGGGNGFIWRPKGGLGFLYSSIPAEVFIKKSYWEPSGFEPRP